MNKNNLLLSPEVRFHDKGAENLIMWFGGINEPHFSDKLSEATGFDQLTVTDAAKKWYTGGLVSGHACIKDGVHDLNSLIAERGYRNVVFCGQSSGGYGALLYGYHVRANLCIVFSPQTRNTYDGQCKMSPHVKLDSLGDLYRDHVDTRLVFNMARSEKDHEDSFFWDDWRQVNAFRSLPNATFITHPFDNHSVSVRIRETRNLYHYVAGIVTAFL